MTNHSLLIKNACIVNEGQTIDGDVLIRAGRIERISAGITAAEADDIIDAGGLHLLPGLIDDQVHFREPGLTAKGDIATESAAAVAGGITSFMEMPNVKPPTTDRQALEDKYARATGRSRANFAFYLGASNDNLDEIRRLEPTDACGIKMFMGASTGNMLVDDPEVLDRVFADSPLLLVTHCEDTPMITANEQAMREKYGDDVPMAEHPVIRSAEACYASSSLAVELARRHDARLHVFHLTTGRELELFAPGPIGGKSITAEVCVHHLFFDESRYADLGTQIKCNPAIKTAADREALLDGLATGRLDVVATDHAPHLAEEKAGTYFNAPAGLPLVQHALLSLLEHVHDGRLSLELVVTRSSHAVADLFGITERGYIREGYRADLVLVDLKGKTTVSPKNILYKCGWSPFDGYRFRSSIAATLVNGVIAYRDGIVTDEIAGQRLDCNSARDLRP
ncbi:MAG: dihydroorotase [Chromatiales bacterium]|jgi:dihydroorotase|nr:dihydroorotase [Chromatiales bacterium]